MIAVEKPLRLLNGLEKMVIDPKWKASCAELKRLVSDSWDKMSDAQQQDLYTQACALFMKATRKIIGVGL